MKLLHAILPATARRRLHAALTHLQAPKPSTRPPEAMRGHPVVAGLFSTPSGIGESSRLCYAALGRLGLRPAALDLSPRFDPAGGLRASVESIATPPPGAPLIIHLNPPELPYAAQLIGAEAMQGRLVVGYWAWELPEMPRAWRSGFSYVHEIWVPSEFCAAAIRPWTDKPVHVVPHPLTPLPAASDRAGFGLPQDRLALLSVCDLRSSLARKNLTGNIAAFRVAFDRRGEAMLVIKLSGGESAPDLLARLRMDIANQPDLRLIDAVLTPERMAALYESMDGFLSLHRAEGFGLGIAETMLRGKVAIATDWSGSRDFLNAGNGLPIPCRLTPVADPQGIYPDRRQQWAEPDQAAAIAALRLWAAEPTLRQQLGAAAKVTAARYFGDEAYARALSPRFRQALPKQ